MFFIEFSPCLLLKIHSEKPVYLAETIYFDPIKLKLIYHDQIKGDTNRQTR